MINLLPNKTKKEIHAARTNIVLIDYVVFLIVAIIFLVITFASIYFQLNSMKNTAEETIKNATTNNSFYDQNNQTGDIGAVIATAQSILTRRISYSDIVIGIGTSLPFGSIVNKISLTESLLNTPLRVDFRAKSTSIVPELLANLQKIPIFNDVQCQPAISASDLPDYPILISCNLMINRAVSL